MAEVKKEFPHMYHTGHPVGQPFGYDFFEFYVSGGTRQRYKDVYGVDMPDQQITLRPGDSVFVDLTGDGKVDANDVHAIGYSDIPEYTGSMNATLDWKGLKHFSMTWVGATHVTVSLVLSILRPSVLVTSQCSINGSIIDTTRITPVPACHVSLLKNRHASITVRFQTHGWSMHRILVLKKP